MRPHRDFLVVSDFSRAELDALFALALRMKKGGYARKPLAGQALAMIFTKSSTRTRVSFQVGVGHLGGQSLFLSPREMQLGRGEPIADTARVLARMCSGIVIRTSAHAELDEFAKAADIPVINGLSDAQHPCQILADLLTVIEAHGGYAGKRIAWIGDGNNVANSWLDAAAILGFELRLACPKGFEPDAKLLAHAQKRAKVLLTRDPREAADGAHVVTTDVWASMGQEQETAQRDLAFAGYAVTDAIMKCADRGAIFLHCLPAHRGQEVAASVIDGRQSRVWDEAENRLHIQKAIMAVLMGGERLTASGRLTAHGRRPPAKKAKPKK
jgi:ornithine carbamoyltransferase